MASLSAAAKWRRSSRPKQQRNKNAAKAREMLKTYHGPSAAPKIGNQKYHLGGRGRAPSFVIAEATLLLEALRAWPAAARIVITPALKANDYATPNRPASPLRHQCRLKIEASMCGPVNAYFIAFLIWHMAMPCCQARCEEYACKNVGRLVTRIANISVYSHL